MDAFEAFDLWKIPKILSGVACHGIRFAIILFAIVIVYVGIKFLLSRGNPTELNQVKKIFLTVLVGGLVVFGVFTIILSFSSYLGVSMTWAPMSCDGTYIPPYGSPTPTLSVTPTPSITPTPTLTITPTPTPTPSPCPNPVCISSENESNITANSVTITWTTNVPATSQVEYISATYSLATTPINNNLVTNHSVVINNLQPDNTYNYRAISTASGYTARGSQFSFRTAISGQCVNIAGTGPNRVVLIASNITPPNRPCSSRWTSSDISSTWIADANRYTELLSRFPPANASNFSLYRSDALNSNACSNTKVKVNVMKCSYQGSDNYGAFAIYSLREVWIAHDRHVTGLAHEALGHAYADLHDEYYYNTPYPPPNTAYNEKNCKYTASSCPNAPVQSCSIGPACEYGIDQTCNTASFCPGGISRCYGGCNQQGPGTGWYRDAPSDLMYETWIDYNQFGPVDTQVIQSCIATDC